MRPVSITHKDRSRRRRRDSLAGEGRRRCGVFRAASPWRGFARFAPRRRRRRSGRRGGGWLCPRRCAGVTRAWTTRDGAGRCSMRVRYSAGPLRSSARWFINQVGCTFVVIVGAEATPKRWPPRVRTAAARASGSVDIGAFDTITGGHNPGVCRHAFRVFGRRFGVTRSVMWACVANGFKCSAAHPLAYFAQEGRAHVVPRVRHSRWGEAAWGRLPWEWSASS